MAINMTSLDICKNVYIHKESGLNEQNFGGAEDIERIYELARESGKNYTLARELEKHYLMDCSTSENFDGSKNKNDGEEDNNVNNGVLENINCSMHDDGSVDLNYLSR